MSLGTRRAGVLLLLAGSYAPLGLATEPTSSGPTSTEPAAEPTTAPAAPAPKYEFQCGEALTVWRKARDPAARDCCALVVLARAGLWTTPARTRDLAARAGALCPTGIEAAVLAAAAALAAGEVDASHDAFERASVGKNAQNFARLPPAQRLLAARAASLAGARGRALEHYRSVILDLDQLPSAHERARVLLEAALLAAHASPPELAEAHAYLRQSAEHLSPRLHAVRRLVARAIGPGLAPSAAFARADDGAGPAWQPEDATEVVLWMQTGDRGPIAAPGGILPAVGPDLLAELVPRELVPRELLPRELAAPVQDESETNEAQAAP